MSPITLTIITPAEIALIYSGFAVLFGILFVGMLRLHLKADRKFREEFRAIRHHANPDDIEF